VSQLECVCGRSFVGVAGSNPAGGMVVCVLSGRRLFLGLITRPEDFYRVWCVWVWSWTLDNEKTLAHYGLQRHGRKKTCQIGIVTRLGVGRLGVWIPAGAKGFLFSKINQTGSGAHLTAYAMGTGAFSRGCKAAGAWNDHWPPSSAEVMSKRSYTSTPNTRLHGMGRETFAFLSWNYSKHINMFCGWISELYSVQVMITTRPDFLYRVGYINMWFLSFIYP
jgi:hypothetical protein